MSATLLLKLHFIQQSAPRISEAACKSYARDLVRSEQRYAAKCCIPFLEGKFLGFVSSRFPDSLWFENDTEIFPNENNCKAEVICVDSV